MELKDIRDSIKQSLELDLTPIISVENMVNFFTQLLDLSQTEITHLLEKRTFNYPIKAVVIQNNANYGFADQEKLKKIFNEFTECQGFAFHLTHTIAFMCKARVDDIYILVDDLKEPLQELYQLLPRSKFQFVRKQGLWNIEDNPTNTVETLAQQLKQADSTITKLKARIAELESQKQVETPIIAEPKQVRIQRHHKALFALLVNNNYKGFDTRNSLFNAINADLKLNGIIGNEVKFDTYKKLIDDDLFKQLEIFPNKQR